MKFDRKYKPDRVASSDYTRTHLTGVYLDVDAKRMVATNGHALIAVPCTPEPGDHEGVLTKETLSDARRDKKPRVRAKKKLVDTGRAIHRRPQVTFPSWKQVMSGLKKDGATVVTFGVNPRLLMDIATAAGQSGFRMGLALTFAVPEAGKEMLDMILVKSAWVGEEFEACVMPMRVGK